MMIKSFRLISIAILVIFLLPVACKRQHKAPDISAVDVDDVTIHRYERALFDLGMDNLVSGLDSMHGEYRIFLGDNYKDTLSLIRLRDFLSDPLIIELKAKSDQVFPDLRELEQTLTQAFRYHKHYFPEKAIPKVYTYISGLYYESPVELADSAMIISLDLFLGGDFEPYRAIGLPNYVSRRMRPEYILPESMKQLGYSLLPPDQPGRTLLDQMVLHGKVLYYVQSVLSGLHDTLITGYTEQQLSWCRDHEASIWSFLIENELLYSSDPFIINKFIQDGPFTAGLPEASPAMLGRWAGWQIIRSYMRTESGTTLSELFANTDAQKILSDSRYKPSR